MALELKNKVAKEKEEKKGAKYKRKRNVFGKRLTRIGIIVLIAIELIAFGVVKTIFTLNQNKRQKSIENDIAKVNQEIKKTNNELRRNVESYENVGNLIATLPTSFDQQATSLDLDRMIILSGLSEATGARKVSKKDAMPIECSVSSVKAVEITLTLYGKNDDISSVIKFIDYLTDYNHENFYYISNFDYSEDRSIYKRTTTNITLYTFYNDTTLS